MSWSNHAEVVIVPAFFLTIGYIVSVMVSAVQRRRRSKRCADADCHTSGIVLASSTDRGEHTT